MQGFYYEFYLGEAFHLLAPHLLIGGINMRESIRIDREIRDMKIASKCNECCLNCDKYKSIKEQDMKCEVVKARKRMIDREIYQLKKKKAKAE